MKSRCNILMNFHVFNLSEILMCFALNISDTVLMCKKRRSTAVLFKKGVNPNTFKLKEI